MKIDLIQTPTISLYAELNALVNMIVSGDHYIL